MRLKSAMPSALFSGEVDPQNMRGSTLHPAVEAWQAFSKKNSVPTAIIVLKPEHRKSAVYRVAGVGPLGSNIIVKRCRRETAKIEQMIYERILPRLPLPRLRYFGILDSPSARYCWSFFEDAGETLYSSEEHQELAAHWLGVLHTSAEEIARTSALPERGTNYYLNVLRTTREKIHTNISNPALTSDHCKVLESLLNLCGVVEKQWGSVEEFCERMPRTLVHGDFVSKNARVCRRDSEVVLLVFDWESAGYGVPGADLADVSVAHYYASVHNIWQHLNATHIQQMKKYGQIFRLLEEINWAAEGLSYEWVEKTMKNYMSVYNSWLATSMQALGWMP